MLNAKERLGILILGMMVFLTPFLINQILIIVNSPLNPTEINLYQFDTKIEYTYEEGTYEGEDGNYVLDITVPDNPEEEYNQISVSGEEETEYKADYETGKYVEGGEVQDVYTIFWVPVKNPMLNFWEFIENREFDVVDPIGLIGSVGEQYKLVIGERKVYWDVAPGLDGAQFSFVIDIFDQNDTKVAEGLMDSTCGFLEVLDATGKGKIEIQDPGNFPISRNRYNMLWWGIICAVAAPVLVYIFLKKKEVQKDKIEEITLLLGVSSTVVLFDIIIDVWFYARIGRSGMLYIHLGLFATYALICWYLKYGIKWALPAFLEVAFVFAITTFVGDPYVPHITAFMGLYASYLAMLFRSGLEKRGYENKLDIIV